jgi:hypothetical protein
VILYFCNYFTDFIATLDMSFILGVVFQALTVIPFRCNISLYSCCCCQLIILETDNKLHKCFTGLYVSGNINFYLLRTVFMRYYAPLFFKKNII